jgi:hypothetical protein
MQGQEAVADMRVALHRLGVRGGLGSRGVRWLAMRKDARVQATLRHFAGGREISYQSSRISTHSR